MISFIIIGKNEGWKLLKSIESVFKAIEINKIKNSEVIYVDSKSTDNTLNEIKKYKYLKVALITGDVNAAVARNIGFKESTNQNLVFIDGDMEIQSDFLPLIIDNSNNLKFPFCSGNWINYNYDNFQRRKLLSKEIKKEMTKNEIEFISGGLFAIRRDTWESVGGMRTVFRRSQDWDLALRLAKKDVFLYRLKEVFAHHHTLSPKESINKMWSMFRSGYKLYRIVILRGNFFNKYQWKHFIRINYTFILFLVMLISFLISGLTTFIFVYFAAIFIRNLFTYRNKLFYVLNGFVIALLYDIAFLGALFFFYPKKLAFKYKVIQKPN